MAASALGEGLVPGLGGLPPTSSSSLLLLPPICLSPWSFHGHRSHSMAHLGPAGRPVGAGGGGEAGIQRLLGDDTSSPVTAQDGIPALKVPGVCGTLSAGKTDAQALRWVE